MNPLFDLQSMVATWMLSAQTQTAGGKAAGFAIGGNSMMAGSPFSDYTVAAVIYVIVIGFLVTGLLIGGILVVNLAMMSKRDEDRIGGRAPSDVGILKDTIWPNEQEPPPVLPAEEWDEEKEGMIASELGAPRPPSHPTEMDVDREAETRKRDHIREVEERAEEQELQQERMERRRRAGTAKPKEPGRAA